MYNGLKSAFIFVLGAAVGSAVTWKLLKTKYDQIVQEEIDSFKETVVKKREMGEALVKGIQAGIDSASYDKYSDLTKPYQAEEGGSDSMDKPYILVIPPDEFGEDEDYDTESLILYTDGVLADDQGNKIEDINDLVGESSLDCFGEYEDDSVFVRNEKYKTEYEIVKDYRPYDAVFNGTDQSPAEDE